MKPKMQLSSGCPVSDPFRAEINAWMIDFFGYEDEPEVVKPPVFDDVALVIKAAPVQKTKPTKARHKTQVPPKATSLRSLLDGLSDSFYTMQVPPITGSWLAKRDIAAIKKIGLYVPDTFDVELQATAAGQSLPAIASAFLSKRIEDTADRIQPRFVYAIKGAMLPVNVEVTRGVPYQFGMCFEIKRTETDVAMVPKLFWSYCWIVVRPDGSIRIPHELRPVTSNIRHKRAMSGYKGQYGSRSSASHTRQWCLPTLAIAEEGKIQSDYEEYLKAVFVQLVKWWNGRSQEWSVSVKKDGHRVTFSVKKEHTSGYFADRETVVNVDGKPRKIVHYVRAHDRIDGSFVKAHIRGLREFDWNGYHCHVTAPEFSALTTIAPLSPMEVTGKVNNDKNLLTTLEVAELLASYEDAHV